MLCNVHFDGIVKYMWTKNNKVWEVYLWNTEHICKTVITTSYL